MEGQDVLKNLVQFQSLDWLAVDYAGSNYTLGDESINAWANAVGWILK